MKLKILFICMYNLRNPMAVSFLSHKGESKFDIHSAWIESDELNPEIENVMQEVGMDISKDKNKTKRYFDISQSDSFQYVITICDDRTLEKCPIFPNANKRLYWNLENPHYFEGSKEEKMEKIREIRDEIKKRVDCLVQEVF